jgi:hypothetical protein
MQEPLFQTQRKKVIDAYKAASEPFVASTKPYKSTVSWVFTRANTITASSVAWLIARGGQRLQWFSYKIGDVVPGNQNLATPYRAALEDDTNISKARTTNGAEDFVIEGMSASNRSTRISYNAGDGGSGTGAGTNLADVTDADALSALRAGVPIFDPAALYTPPQIQSPFNLEAGLYRAIAGHISVEFEWDRGRIVKMGTLEQIPEGGANSYLRAVGEPSTNDRYRIPEGYLWRREGQPDCEFVVSGILQEPVAVPILNVAVPESVTPTIAVLGVAVLDVVLRLHGLSVKLPSRN